MDSREAFKAGFALGCADLGLDGQQIKELTQQAATLLEKSAGISDSVSGGLSKVLNAGTMLGVGLPVLGGAGLGYMAHKATTPDIDEEDVKKLELIQELKQYARRAKEHQKNRLVRMSIGG